MAEVTQSAGLAELIDLAHTNAEGLNIATFAEIDDVIDPADTRQRIVAALRAHGPITRGERFVDPR